MNRFFLLGIGFAALALGLAGCKDNGETAAQPAEPGSTSVAEPLTPPAAADALPAFTPPAGMSVAQTMEYDEANRSGEKIVTILGVVPDTIKTLVIEGGEKPGTVTYFGLADTKAAKKAFDNTQLSPHEGNVYLTYKNYVIITRGPQALVDAVKLQYK